MFLSSTFRVTVRRQCTTTLFHSRPLVVSLVDSINNTTTTSSHMIRSYISRAHPVPTPTYNVDDAVRMVIEGCKQRVIRRQALWDRNREKRIRRGENVDTDFDETIELAVNLNLDPRKPNQSLRGNMILPHGNGKNKDIKVMVFTSNDEMAKQLLEGNGDGNNTATYAGGEELIDQIVNGDINILKDLDRTLADQGIMPYVTSKLARILGPRGFMPNNKVGTLVSTPQELPDALERQFAGEVLFRTESAGIIHLGIGKGSFEWIQIMENIQTVMETLQDLKPEKYGRGVKKPTSHARYILRVHLTATQQKGSYRLELSSINPLHKNFMGDEFKKVVADMKKQKEEEEKKKNNVDEKVAA